VRRTLDIWPPLPIVLDHINPPLWDVDNIVAALECNERVRDSIDLTATFITIGGLVQRLFIPFVCPSVTYAGLPIPGRLAEIERFVFVIFFFFFF
jgi:hypothetical protein